MLSLAMKVVHKVLVPVISIDRARRDLGSCAGFLQQVRRYPGIKNRTSALFRTYSGLKNRKEDSV